MTDGNDGGEIAASGMLPNDDFHTVVLNPCHDEHGDSGRCQCRPECKRDSELAIIVGKSVGINDEKLGKIDDVIFDHGPRAVE